MGADGVVVFFGVKFEIPAEDELLEPLERETDERMLRARKHGLEHWFGRLTDGEPYHLFVGHRLGDFGIEGEFYRRFSADEFAAIVSETRTRLAAAGFDDEPALHFQLEAQY